MKGFRNKCVATLGVAGGLAVACGCANYRNVVDPCYPERYEFASRKEVIEAFTPQVSNGHILDQTVWNYQFEPGTDRLTPGGMEHLTYLARRRPFPDGTIYLATAHDLVYDPATPEKYAEQRASMDAKRIQAIQNYLTAETAGRHVSFEVVVHDPPEQGIAATPMGISVQKMYSGFQGILGTGVGVGGAGAAGAAPPPGGGGAPGGTPAGPPS
jgi:hypothetical protein